MKRLKNIISQMTSRMTKERLLALICISVAVVAVTLSAMLFVGNAETAEDDTSAKQATERITYPSSSPKSLEFQSIGNGLCVVAGIGGFDGDELDIPEKSPSGEEVVGIASGAFEGCDRLLSVSIPASVTAIGDGVFKGCSSLALISVDSRNSKYASSGGILFSKNKSLLICYPAARAGSSYLMNPNVSEIASHAFYGVRYLGKINYEGSISEFGSIRIGEGNKALSEIPITCNYYPTK